MTTTFLGDLYRAVRRALVFAGNGVTRVNGQDEDTITIDTSSGLNGDLPGTQVGHTIGWTGSAWAVVTNVFLTSGTVSAFNLLLKANSFLGMNAATSGGTQTTGINGGGQPLKNYRDARGNATTIATGAGTEPLKLTADTTTLPLLSVVDDDEVNTLRFQVRVEDSDGSDAWTDDLKFYVKRTAGDIRVSDGANNSNAGVTATLIVAGPDSTYNYTIDLADDTNEIQLSLAEDGAIAREARVTTWWETEEDVS